MRVVRQTLLARVRAHPERRDDDQLRALPDQAAEGFGEGEVPADQDADRAERGFDDGMRVGGRILVEGGRGRQVWAFRVPEVAFGVGAQ